MPPFDIRVLAAAYTEANIRLLAEFAGCPEVPVASRIQAIGMLLDRAYGRVAQPVTGANGEGPIKVEIVYPAKDEP